MLQSLHINGYRLLGDFTADFRQLTVVVGANASGKSTLLDSLRFISNLAEYPLKDVLSWHGGPWSLMSASMETSELRVRAKFDNAGKQPWPMLGADGTFVYDLGLQWQPAGQVLPSHEKLLLEGANGQSQVLLVTDENGSFIYDETRRQLAPFDQAVKAPPQAAETSGVSPVPESGLRLTQMRFYNEYPTPSNARTVLGWFHCYPGFDVATVKNKLPEIRPETFLLPNGENLGNVLHEVLTRFDYRNVAEEIRSFLTSAYPQFEEITAETAYGGAPARVLVRIREKGMRRPMELWDVSDGMLRFLCLATALLTPATRSLVAIDEPEAGLHPRLMPIVADMIKAASERTQVLVLTHSPDLLSQFDIDDVAVMTRHDAQAEWQRPGTRKSLKDMLANVIGDSLADLHRTGELEALHP